MWLGKNRKMADKKCFIITPIGDKSSTIRRHIDGIIDAVLTPVLENTFDYEVEVAHRIDAPGNIPKQVILSIYNSDLVIANMTGNNPNVMYELALRHCFGTPAIMIAEEGTKIPADIVSERTIMYINDAQGVIELKKTLENMIRQIQETKDNKPQGPVYDALRSEITESSVIQTVSEAGNADAFSLLLDKIEEVQRELRHGYNRPTRIMKPNHSPQMHIKAICKSPIEPLILRKIVDSIDERLKRKEILHDIIITSDEVIEIIIDLAGNPDLPIIMGIIKNTFRTFGENEVEITQSMDFIPVA